MSTHVWGHTLNTCIIHTNCLHCAHPFDKQVIHLFDKAIAFASHMTNSTGGCFKHMVKKEEKSLLFLLFLCYFTWASIFLSAFFLLHILMLNLTGGQLNPCMCFLFWIITNIKIWNKNDWFLKNKRKKNTNMNEFGSSPIWHAKYRTQLDCLSWCGSSKKLTKTKTEEESKT